MRDQLTMRQSVAGAVARLVATHAEDESSAGDGRVISYVFSDESVARDGHTIRTDGWELANFLSNPVFLWCHETRSPPIGRVVSVGAQGSRLIGAVEYADADTYPFADTIFRLMKGGFLNAVSVQWAPIEWKYSSDKSRPGGIDFKRQELLEVSAVPVPALPTALATARASGIDTRPLVEWAERVLDSGDSIILPRAELERLRREAQEPKSMSTKPASRKWNCDASRNLPLSQEVWAPDDASFEKRKHARKAYLAVDNSETPVFWFQFAEEVEGRLTANIHALRAAARDLDAADLPDDVKKKVREVIAHYESKATAPGPRTAPALGKRGLYEVGWLASILNELGYIEEWTEWEAEQEGDGSEVPAKLLAAMKQLGQVLIDMTVEEVAELVGGEEEAEGAARAAALCTIRKLDIGALSALRAAAQAHLDGKVVTFTHAAAPTPQSIARAGKTLSAGNEAALEDIHTRIEETRCMMRAFIDGAKGDGGEESRSAAAGDAAKRARRARALRAKLNLIAAE